MTEKKDRKTLFAVVAVVLVTWLVAFVYEPGLPEQVPSHWNIHGEVDGYMAKPWGVFFMPLLSTGMSILLWILPMIAPKGFKLDNARSVYELLVLIIALFMLGVMVLTFEAGLNDQVDMNQWMMVGIGALFLILGNYLSKVPKNFFIGIKTPWTLASDEVWYKTHRLGSWTFFIAGLLVILGGFLQWPFGWMIGLLVAAGVIPLIYSLVIYKKIEGFKE
ncbi:SdpI family protein [Marinicella sediminis]|uniref:SdpI family protein n=1 Tax=Marinicella sediminis TaxID=1792834 RepID=A0ABV7JA37_9GAMM|nr:SdpI family protein [Marinicella sediminis]